uniref:Zinc finger PMZ-type domain-containing protein n=1 Tax=Tanacetum cinerariifolium TaxID=118510 RepID=A0A6L2J020_TANCI|nr:hypothetical protein [Tanacetum cinerariifolium]
MVVPLPFTVNLYHDEIFQVNPLEYVNFESKVIDDVSFDEHNGYNILEMIYEELHPKKPVSHVDADSDVETNHPLDDVAHVTENPNPNLSGRLILEVEDPDDECVNSKFKAKQNVSYPSFNHDTPWNECKPVLGMRFKKPTIVEADVSEGKCATFEGNKPKTVDNEECETRKHGGKKGDARKVVDNEDCETSKHGSKKGDGRNAVNERVSKYRQAILDINPGSACELDTEVNDEDGKLYFKRFYVCFHGVKQGWDDLNLGDGGGISMILHGDKVLMQAIADWLLNAEHKQLFPSGYRVVEVRRVDQSFGVNLHQMKCVYNMRQLSGIPCVHAMAGHMHIRMNPDLGFDEWYFKCKWYEVYQFSINLVYGPKFWKPTSQPPLLPPLERKMLGRPKKGELDIQQKIRTMHLLGMPPHTATQSTSNTMSLPHTLSTSNTMPPPSGSNTMPPPFAPSVSNTMPSHATLGSNTSTGSNTMPSHATFTSIGPNKGNCPLILKKDIDLPKVMLLVEEVVLGVVQIAEVVQLVEVVLGVVQPAKKKNKLKLMRMTSFWEDCARKFDQVEEYIAQDKAMPKDVSAGKQPMDQDKVIIKHMAKGEEKSVFWIINEEVRESILNRKNTTYHSRRIHYFPRLRQDLCLTLKNTPYSHQQIRRVRYFGQHSEEMSYIQYVVS